MCAASPKTGERAAGKEIHPICRERERIKQEHAASVKAAREKTKVVENQNEIIPAKAIKGRIRCAFTNIRGKEIMGRK